MLSRERGSSCLSSELELGGTSPWSRYCYAHTGMAAAPHVPEAALATPPMVGLSLRLRGDWIDPEGNTVAFDIATSLAHGILETLEDGGGAAAAYADLAAGAPVLEVRFVRRLADLADGIEPGGTDPDTAGWAALNGLARGGAVQLTARW